MSTELEDRLRQRMEYATAEIRVPRDLARRAVRHRKRRIAVRAGAAIGTAAAVAAAVVVSTATGAPRDSGTAETARLASDVESAVAAAVADDILHTTKATNIRQEEWSYRSPREDLYRNQMFTASGQPWEDQGFSVTSNAYAAFEVSYPARTWFTRTLTLHGMPIEPTPRISCSTPIFMSPGNLSQEPATLAADIREALSCGQLIDEGTEYVDGVNAIKLVTAHTAPRAAVFTNTLWVDPATHLPVQYEWTNAYGGHKYSQTLSIAWLPPTRANLALVRVPIPAGFTQVQPPKGYR
jgi:hypothetical protein